ncbi:uncharacterized protein V6R79_016111 [Siganus canaliculatus]
MKPHKRFLEETSGFPATSSELETEEGALPRLDGRTGQKLSIRSKKKLSIRSKKKLSIRHKETFHQK